MSDYFDSNINRVTKNSLAKSEQVNNLRDEVGIAFDKLPTPNLIATGAVTYGVDSGTADNYIITLPVTATSYSVGMSINFKVANENTGASTINVDGLGTKSIKTIDGDDLPAGALKTTIINTFTYNGSTFVLAGVTSAILEYYANEASDARDDAVAAEALTNADAEQTALDRIQTGEDVTASTSAKESAEAASDAAIAAYDSFDDRYLGEKASDPTLDNDGDSLVIGALYFNSTIDKMKCYSSTGWEVAYRPLQYGLTDVTSGAVVDLDMSSEINFNIIMDTNITFTFSGLSSVVGNAGVIILQQDATGGRVFTLPAEAKTPFGGATITQTTTANTTSSLSYFIIDSSTVIVNYVGNYA